MMTIKSVTPEITFRIQLQFTEIILLIDECCALNSVSDELFAYVKTELQKRGFFLKEFSSLPRDLSTGSREMLLAFGWILCKENIVQKFMQSCTSPLEDDTAYLYMHQVRVIV